MNTRLWSAEKMSAVGFGAGTLTGLTYFCTILGSQLLKAEDITHAMFQLYCGFVISAVSVGALGAAVGAVMWLALKLFASGIDALTNLIGQNNNLRIKI